MQFIGGGGDNGSRQVYQNSNKGATTMKGRQSADAETAAMRDKTMKRRHLSCCLLLRRGGNR